MTAPQDDIETLGFRPLYRQVRDRLIRNLVDGVWAPGEALPSEMQLAADLGVSQGTVRKALDAMAAENLVVRRQGRGTFVARHDEERILFQFFKLVPDSGPPSFPDSRVLSLSQGRADANERSLLALAPGSRVIRIKRVRSIENRPVIAEAITLPAALFPDLAGMAVPNNLYGLYAMHYGITIANTQEKLKAVGASADDAAILGIAPGAPVLQIDRLALALDKTPVERRLSICVTHDLHYLSDLS
ncbi:MAG: GntR family transcriptional regulator [Chelatococcus sp.]|uniref:GntR family transcriptional regulator n=1 Tax=Chelatococcus sp. TaxID=1953771 RepID=UPI0025C00472|nr:GntR family transcriptional regulator [Chelatococcus sp.]MBX3539263.1 GntR family transcriptional regulator [Chelatococcus sp.]